MIRYTIYCLLSGKPKKEILKLKKEVSERFGLMTSYNEDHPPHFTVKYSFVTDRIGDVEKVIEDFCRGHKRSKFVFGGAGGFPSETVFIKIKESPEMRKSFIDLIQELKKINWLSFNKYDGENLIFHSTIAEECGEKYEAVLKFTGENEFYEECWFDNISIHKYIDDKKVVLHRRFNLDN